mmetsp:Transcript_26713/g.73168  ORF Transcript_26713/g.73168 Transcript_26713/m.73168 type:complete len:174 (-) Transcript_26713:341-862(-)
MHLLGPLAVLLSASRPIGVPRCAHPLLIAPREDPFAIVGVRPDASVEEVQRAFRKRSRELHPDAGGSVEKFQKLVSAYEILQDPVRREELSIAATDSLDFTSQRGKVYGSSESLRRHVNVVQAGARERAERAAQRANAAEASRAAMAQRKARMAKRSASSGGASSGSQTILNR